MADKDTKVVSGPIALIKVNNVTIGKIKNFRATETYGRGEVRGLGQLQLDQVPIMSMNGSFSIDSFLVNLKDDGIKGLMPRGVTSPAQFFNTLMTGNEKGVDIYVYKKVAKTTDATTGLVTAVAESPLAIIRKCFLDSMNFDVSEGAIAGYSQSGRFLEPIYFVS